MSDEKQIRDIVTGWAEAIRTKDLDGVVANHGEDIVMFDVPPPFNGVRGTDDYRKTWPPFFEFIDSGAAFEIVELDVVTGADTAFAYGLLKCGTPDMFETSPDNRLRLTMGFQKRDGRWLITHEHHSFPMMD